MDSEPVLRQMGVVRSVDGGRALIAVEAQGCSACGKRSACGAGKLAGNGRQVLLDLPVAEAVAPGDVLTVEISERRLLAAALRGYLLPAALLILGAGLGEAVGGDGAAALGALIGLIAGLALVRRARGGVAPLVLRR